ncbi:NUMOD4 motif-containing HNH endonuclease [Staphylococcus aureus]|nr:NUMOD4 motif-containing HNH endonuclease [Staphylococcus aureus]MBH4613456.1 NUMOD4 motif-containing HNH endonuclease [Staphylococcus aureus]
MTEVWKDVPGYEGYYQASNLGRIKSTERIVKHNCGGPKKISGRILKGHVNKHGYLRVDLSKEGIRKSFSIHRIVAMAFLGGTDLVVNHIDGIKTNNNINNLEYVTPQENTAHAVRTGLIKNNSRINKDSIIKDYQNGSRLRELENKYNTSHHDIRKILSENNVIIESKGTRRRRYQVDENELRQLIKDGYNNSEIARKMNVSRHCIRYRRKLLISLA